MHKVSVFWAAAYVAAGVASFGVVAWYQSDRMHVVKVKQVPPMAPKPTEIKR